MEEPQARVRPLDINPVSQHRADLFSSRPQAGFPSPGDADVERSLRLDELLIKHPASTFFVRVEGDSMEGAGIVTGDILVVDRSLCPSDGSIVVAALYGELVVKRLSISGGVYRLVSENEHYEPIPLDSPDAAYVWGVVVGSVRTYLT